MPQTLESMPFTSMPRVRKTGGSSAARSASRALLNKCVLGLQRATRMLFHGPGPLAAAWFRFRAVLKRFEFLPFFFTQTISTSSRHWPLRGMSDVVPPAGPGSTRTTGTRGRPAPVPGGQHGSGDSTRHYRGWQRRPSVCGRCWHQGWAHRADRRPCGCCGSRGDRCQREACDARCVRRGDANCPARLRPASVLMCLRDVQGGPMCIPTTTRSACGVRSQPVGA